MNKSKRISPSELCKIVKCENQMVLDDIYENKKSDLTEKRIKEGLKEHRKFDNLNNMDKRCYIATAIYGQDSPKTNLLRQWRDKKLKVSWYGKIIIKVYYFISPYLVKYSPKLILNIFKFFIDKLINKISKI